MCGPETELERVRRIASEALLERFAAERLPLEEFEERVRAVREAQDVVELRRLLREVGERKEASQGGERAPEAPGGPAKEAPPEGREALRLVTLAGRTEVDLTAELGPTGGVVRILAGPGVTKLVVPPEVAVSVEVVELGGRIQFDPAVRRAGAGDAGAMVRIRGWIVLGSVVVEAGDGR